MEKYLYMLTIAMSVMASPPRNLKVYRSDYEYNHKTDSFYKFHAESKRGSVFIMGICAIEGAEPMMIESQEDINQAHSMFKKYPDLANYAWVAHDGQYHESAEEHPLIYLSQELEDHSPGNCDVISRAGEVNSFPCSQLLPFFCKVKASEAPYDKKCELHSREYQYISSVESCYKISQTAYSWNEAYDECRAEGAHLLVLNSLAESQVIQNLTRMSSRVIGSRYGWFYLAGYRAAPPKDHETPIFKTIFNQTLEEAGFSEWSENEPNNAGNNELCGTIFSNNGKLNDVNCNHNYGFICEKEVPKSQRTV